MKEGGDNIVRFPTSEGFEQKREAREHLEQLVRVLTRLLDEPASVDPPVTESDARAFSQLKSLVEGFSSTLMKRPYDQAFLQDLGELNSRVATSNLIEYLSDEEVRLLGWAPSEDGSDKK